MSKTQVKINYNFRPESIINKKDINLIDDIAVYLNNEIRKRVNPVIIFDCYLGIDQEILEDIINNLKVSKIINLNNYLKSDEEIEKEFSTFLTKHSVNGKYAVGEIYDFYKEDAVREVQENISQSTVIYGIGATSVMGGDIQILVNTTKDTAMKSLLDRNEYLTEKRLKFLDFHLIDVHKRYQINEMDYVLNIDSTKSYMVSLDDYKRIINSILSQPFRTTPLFEENIWGGGKWFKNRLGAEIGDKKVSFIISSILEQQSVLANINGNYLSIPGLDILALAPTDLLGEKIFYTYGYRTPMHIILVDTFGGANSSLQVHPTAGYNQDFMNYPYGHHEGYYIVETNDQSSVYLGVNENYSIEEFTNSLVEAQLTNEFDVRKYVDKLSVEKFDYFYLPGGVVHAFGAETVCLEIDSFSTTTFKLWDWGRLGSDGKPRPIDINLGKKVIQKKFTTSWSKKNLLFRENDYRKESGDHTLRIGTMEYCPMEVKKHWLENKISIKSTNQLMVLVLVEGQEAIIKSPSNAFPDFTMHYMETVYISNLIGEVEVVSLNSERIAIVQVEKEK